MEKTKEELQKECKNLKKQLEYYKKYVTFLENQFIKKE